MADVKKVPYCKPQKGLFGSELKEYKGLNQSSLILARYAD